MTGWLDRIGQYPPEYNVKVHGPYDPARWYGKPDTNIWDVKMGDLKGWINRRNKNPLAMGQAMARAYWRHQHKWMQPYRGGIAGYFQIAFLISTFFYFNNYGKYKQHRWYRYHW